MSVFFVDNRERQLLPLLTLTDPSSQVLALPVGDIWIGLEGDSVAKGGLVIERKTIRDLEASVLDGRYREQRNRLLAFCQEKGAHPMYLLEGSFFATTGRLSAQALMKVVARLQYKHGVPVLQTQGLGETAILIQTLCDYWTEDPTHFHREGGVLRSIDGLHVTKKVNAEDPRQFQMACLSQCPGISTRMAEVIHTAYPSWPSLLGASESEMAALVQPNGRKVGPAVAKRLWGLIHA